MVRPVYSTSSTRMISRVLHREGDVRGPHARGEPFLLVVVTVEGDVDDAQRQLQPERSMQTLRHPHPAGADAHQRRIAALTSATDPSRSSSASSASASGSFMTACKVGLQDLLGRDLVQHLFLAPPAHAGIRERETRRVRGQPLVDQLGVDAEAAAQPPGEACGSAATARARVPSRCAGRPTTRATGRHSPTRRSIAGSARGPTRPRRSRADGPA